MGNNTQNNEEQFEMLLMTLEEVRHGICLFQSENQAKWVSEIQNRMGTDKVILHNIADDKEQDGMATVQDFRRWASSTDATVVVVYNLQLLGLRFGDNEVIEKLNFMRDQLLAIEKLFVFGVSPYFNLLISRNARDLYSCVMHHFVFYDMEERMIGIPDFNLNQLSGDDILEVERYKEYKERIQNQKANADISMYLNCMDSWNMMRKHSSYQEEAFIQMLTEEVDKHYLQKEMEIADISSILVLARSWLELEKVEKSCFWYGKALDFVRDELGENHELYAGVLVAYADYCYATSEYEECEKLCDKAVGIYSEKNMKYSFEGRKALWRLADVYETRFRDDQAMIILNDLLEYQINKYGKNYYENAKIYNNIGIMYDRKGDWSNALQQYKKALTVLESSGKQGGWLVNIYNSICVLYLRNGDASTAWRYIKKAKKIAEEVYGENSSHLISIYNSMCGVWNVRKRPDRELEYAKKAVELIQKSHIENSEIAANTYFNMGKLLFVTKGDIAAAINYCERAIKIDKKIYGEKNEYVAMEYEQLAYIYYQADSDKGKEYIEDAREIYVSLYGSQCEAVTRIDTYLNERGKHELRK